MPLIFLDKALQENSWTSTILSIPSSVQCSPGRNGFLLCPLTQWSVWDSNHLVHTQPIKLTAPQMTQLNKPASACFVCAESDFKSEHGYHCPSFQTKHAPSFFQKLRKDFCYSVLLLLAQRPSPAPPSTPSYIKTRSLEARFHRGLWGMPLAQCASRGSLCF